MSLNARKSKVSGIFCNVPFDGAIQSAVRADLMKEFIKYVLYQRDQIPFPVEQVEEELNLLEKQMPENKRPGLKSNAISSDDTSETMQGCKNGLLKQSRHHRTLRTTVNKLRVLVKSLDNLMSHVSQAFEQCPEIHQALVVLGATPVSPRECYTVQFPPFNPDQDILKSKHCRQLLFRKLISENFLGDALNTSTTNLFLFLQAPRNVGIDIFHPKPSYKKPYRGKQFFLNLGFTNDLSKFNGHNLTSVGNVVDVSGINTLEASDVDISGIELLDCNVSGVHRLDSSDIHMSLVNGAENLPVMSEEGPDDSRIRMLSQSSVSTFDSSQASQSTVCSSVESIGREESDLESIGEDELIWYQSPVAVKGLKIKC